MIYFANPATSHGRNHGKVRRSKTGLVGSWEAATFDVTDETYAYSVRTRERSRLAGSEILSRV